MLSLIIHALLCAHTNKSNKTHKKATYNRNHTVCSFRLILASLTQCHGSEIHAICWVYQWVGSFILLTHVLWYGSTRLLIKPFQKDVCFPFLIITQFPCVINSYEEVSLSYGFYCWEKIPWPQQLLTLIKENI